MRALAALVVGLTLAACGTPAPAPARPPGGGSAPTPGSGVVAPAALVVPTGVRLPRDFVVESYAPTLAIDPAQPTFTGSIAIAGTLARATDVVWLHAEQLTIDGATAQTSTGDEVALTAIVDAAPGRLALRAAAPLPAGRVTITVRYRGMLDEVDTAGAFRQQVAGAWYAYTQHEALYARRTFPCVDEPDAKVPWTLTLEVPAALVAASNAPIASEETSGAKRVVRFAATPPLPSYLTAFAVGPFDVVEAGASSGGAPIRILALAGRGADAGFAASSTPKILAALERWFGSPYPYAKLDSVAIPSTVGFGAMENPGLVTYRESLLLMPADAPPIRQRRYASVGTHELAHQWFGNLVTPVWWDDLWLNESFASWLPDVILAELFPAWRAPTDVIENRNDALGADNLATARRIRQPIVTEDDVLGAFDGITYGKGAAILRMFAAQVGAERFQRGVRAYLAAHAHGNATAADFLAAIAGVAPELDVPGAMSTFLDQAGAPRLATAIACDGGRGTVTLAQSRYLPTGAAAVTATPRWSIPVCVLAAVGRKVERVCTVMTGETATIALPRCPAWAWPNADGLGYYRASLAPAQWRAVIADSKRLTQPVRLAIASDLMAAVAAGEVGVDVALAAVPTLVKFGLRPELVLAAELVSGASRFVPAASRPRFERWIVKTFPMAVRLGLRPRTGDLDGDRLRSALVPLVAELGREPTLRKDAVARARTWRREPEATRGLVLWLAVRAEPALADGLLAEFRTEPDRTLRNELARALGSVPDAARLEAALALTLDATIDIRDSTAVLSAAIERDDTRPAAEAFVRAHADELLARMPQQRASGMIGWLVSSCDAAAIEPARAFAEAKLAALPGARRRIDQSLEWLGQCAARRVRDEPAIAAWAATL
jgi:alanyl aminopeptidase